MTKAASYIIVQDLETTDSRAKEERTKDIYTCVHLGNAFAMANLKVFPQRLLRHQ